MTAERKLDLRAERPLGAHPATRRSASGRPVSEQSENRTSPGTPLVDDGQGFDGLNRNQPAADEPGPAGGASGRGDSIARPRGRMSDTRIAGRSRFSLSKLTARVLAINVLALLILGGGLLYLGRYEERLIQAELESLRTQALIFAGALGEGAVSGEPDLQQSLEPELARQMVRRMYETTDTRTRLFAVDGTLIADSRFVGGPGGVVEIRPLSPIDNPGWLSRQLNAVYEWMNRLTPSQRAAPRYQERADQTADDYAPVTASLLGEQVSQIWSTGHGGLMLGVAVPVQRLRVVHGGLLVTADNQKIERALKQVRQDILRIFAVALLITILLSSYLASTITRPIRRLADAAEQVRRGHGRQHEIPDFSDRHDEIGELSGALRQMTAALWARMDAIERFAADVAHEIKNPLSSLRSAVETTAKVTDPERQRRLMTIIQEDVVRLDRLITDISDASRLDSELSRAEADLVDIGAMLRMLADLYDTTGDPDGPVIRVAVTDDPKSRLLVSGLESRIVQVFRNLIANAISFSPPRGTIALSAERDGDAVVISVMDEGPGVPEGKLAAIFDRFYTERPVGEKFGTHSGLGLSISKQIIEAHQGEITARNRTEPHGAEFIVRIPAI